MLRKLFQNKESKPVTTNKQKDYIQYCQGLEQTLSELESNLHTSDSPEEIAMMAMQTACDFYGADWCGFLEVDLDLGLWTPYWWHNIRPDDKTQDLLEEFGSAASMPRWVRAMKNNQAMVVPDVQAIVNEYPDEYGLYGRLSVNSLLAVPVKPRPMGFLVVRNPSRFVDRSSMLQMLAFVVLSAINEHRLFESARMTISHENIQSETDILVNMFGNLEIHTSRGVLRESEMNSPLIYRLLAYFLLTRKNVVTSYELAEAVYPGEAVDMDNPGKNIKALLYRFRKSFSLICEEPLITTTPNGYQLNPKLHIMTDLEQFDKCWEVSEQTSSVMNKVELLKQAIRLYRGSVLSAVSADHWLLQTNTHYELKYHACVNELLKILDEAKDYPDVMKYATMSLSVAPENKQAYFYLIYAMLQRGLPDMARAQLNAAKLYLTEEEYKELTEYLGKKAIVPIGFQFP